jgi:hypothetical protein
LRLPGRAQWLDASQTRCLVHWCTPARWADAIYDWVRAAAAQARSACALAEHAEHRR